MTRAGRDWLFQRRDRRDACHGMGCARSAILSSPRCRFARNEARGAREDKGAGKRGTSNGRAGSNPNRARAGCSDETRCDPGERGVSMKDVVILGGARTAMADYNGAFAKLTEIELGAIAAKGALEKTQVSPAEIHHVVFGNALQTS